MLVQIRSKFKENDEEIKQKYDEAKKLINSPEKKSKEKKKKPDYMVIQSMVENHQTISVQIKNDITGLDNGANHFFYHDI